MKRWLFAEQQSQLGTVFVLLMVVATTTTTNMIDVVQCFLSNAPMTTIATHHHDVVKISTMATRTTMVVEPMSSRRRWTDTRTTVDQKNGPAGIVQSIQYSPWALASSSSNTNELVRAILYNVCSFLTTHLFFVSNSFLVFCQNYPCSLLQKQDAIATWIHRSLNNTISSRYGPDGRGQFTYLGTISYRGGDR
jgi:hypothetical protein